MARIPDQAREDIADELRHGVKSVRRIASEHGVGASTVSRIAAEIGAQPAARALTEKATAAQEIDVKALKTAMAHGSLRTAQVILDSYENVDWDRVGPYQRALVFGILIDKAADLTRDEEAVMSSVDAWLRSVVGQ